MNRRLLLLLPFIALLAIGCASSKTPTPAQTQTAVIRLASLAACDQLTRNHPEKVEVVRADVEAAQQALAAGNVSGIVQAVLLRNVKDARDAAYLSEALRLLNLQIDIAAVPKPGTAAYESWLQAFDGCRAGLSINAGSTAP